MFRKEYYLMAAQRACLVVVIEAELALQQLLRLTIEDRKKFEEADAIEVVLMDIQSPQCSFS